MKSAAIILAVFHICVIAGTAQSEQSGKPVYRGPSCLSNFCLWKAPLPSEETLVAKYGPGSEIGKVHCYAVPEQKSYVHFGTVPDLPGKIVTVFVSRAPNCLIGSEKPAAARIAFPAFETKEGIRLGDPSAKVLETYGRPSAKRAGEDGLGSLLPYSRERRGSPFGDTVLVYDGPPDELIQAKFYIHNRKVAAIYISCSE
jgi:hypothetical protein